MLPLAGVLVGIMSMKWLLPLLIDYFESEWSFLFGDKLPVGDLLSL